jgi:hypothetical protein
MKTKLFNLVRASLLWDNLYQVLSKYCKTKYLKRFWEQTKSLKHVNKAYIADLTHLMHDTRGKRV